MFSIDGKIIVCDMSSFTLGVDIAIIEKQKVVSKVSTKDTSQAIQMVYNLCDTQGINNVFIKPLAPMSTNKIVNEFKLFGKTNFSETVDKIHFHVI